MHLHPYLSNESELTGRFTAGDTESGSKDIQNNVILLYYYNGFWHASTYQP